MKAKHLFFLVAAGLFGTLAHAQTPGEVFNLGAFFDVVECVQTSVNGSTTVTCTPTAALQFQNIAITLSDCGSNSDGSVTCSGTWSTSMIVDNVTYSGSILVTKNISAQGVSSYTANMNLVDNSSNIFTSVASYFATGTPTDTVSTSGVYITSPTDSNIGYIGYMGLGPAGQGKGRIPAHFHPSLMKH